MHNKTTLSDPSPLLEFVVDFSSSGASFWVSEIVSLHGEGRQVSAFAQPVEPFNMPQPMFDYADWINRAKAFVSALSELPGEVNVKATVAPPMTRHEADLLARSCPMGLPVVIRDFLTLGSSRCDCHYWWEPPARPWPKLKEIFTYENFIYGGPTFCHPEMIADLQESRLDWAECFDGEDPESIRDRELWTQSTPFAHIGNGDLLALDTQASDRDPPVVYLSHEGGSSIISPSFTGFLRHWETMSYIGPEIWLLSYWLEDGSGYIDSANPKSGSLRTLLTSRP